MVPRTERLVLPALSSERLSCSQMVMSGGFTPPTTLGLWVPGFPLATVPILKRPTKCWLRERCRVLPQRPGSHSVPSFPYEDIIRGSVRNLFSRGLEDQTTGASRWTLRGCPSSPPGQCKLSQARIQQPYVQPSQAPNSLIRVQSSGSCPMMEMKNRYCT